MYIILFKKVEPVKECIIYCPGLNSMHNTYIIARQTCYIRTSRRLSIFCIYCYTQRKYYKSIQILVESPYYINIIFRSSTVWRSRSLFPSRLPMGKYRISTNPRDILLRVILPSFLPATVYFYSFRIRSRSGDVISLPSTNPVWFYF